MDRNDVHWRYTIRKEPLQQSISCCRRTYGATGQPL